MRCRFLALGSLAAVLVLTGCDSSDNDSDTPEGNLPQPTRGTLIEDPPSRIASLSVAELVAALGGNLQGQQLLEFAGTPACRVDVHLLHYHTVAANDAPTTASGALMVPAGTDQDCQGERPLLLYAHGTTSDREFNIADVTDEDNIEGLLMAAAFAADGYIVVAPNYAGYDRSELDYHPYLNADQSAKDMIDALAAARSALPTILAPTTDVGDRLFVTGYSQGGHVAMATHRALQEAGTAVTASAPMSGPYALSAFGDAVFYGQVNAGAPLFLTLLVTSYQRAYGELYDDPAEVYAAQYADSIESLLPSMRSRSELYEEGLLPRDQLLSDSPPDPAYAPYTPATMPSEFAEVFASGFGPDHLFTNELRLAYLQDAQANPDGAFPATSDARPPSAPEHPLREAFRANDLRNWTPTAPMLLCAGSGDPTVFYFNTQFMQSYWADSDAPVSVLDVDAEPAEGDPYEDLKDGFDALKLLVAAEAVAAGATDAGEAAVKEEYHTALVAPFCLLALQSFFDTDATPNALE